MNREKETSSKNSNKIWYKITRQTLDKYEKKGVYFTKPTIVALNDYNYGKITDAKSINYFKNPTSKMYPIDLNRGFETYIDRDQSLLKNKIELVLKYVMSLAAVSNDKNGNCDKTKVFTRAGALNAIMEPFYNKPFAPLKLYVSRYNGNLYIIKKNNEMNEENDDSNSELKPVNTHAAQLMKNVYSDSPNNDPDIDNPTDENIQKVGIFRSNFGKYEVIYSTNIHAIISEEKFTEFDDKEALNECRFVYTKQMWKTLKNKDNKYLRFWLQCYLANVRDLYIGYKTNDGIIDEPIEHYITSDIPKNRFWKPSVCTGILYEFLQNVEKLMSRVNCLETVYVIQYNRDDKSYSFEIFKGKTDKSFITNEYKDFCKSQNCG